MKNCDRKHFFWVNIKTVFSSFISILNIAVSKQKFFISTTQRPWNNFEFRAAAKAQNQYLKLFWYKWMLVCMCDFELDSSKYFQSTLMQFYDSRPPVL